jgi:hypothetical protein
MQSPTDVAGGVPICDKIQVGHDLEDGLAARGLCRRAD